MNALALVDGAIDGVDDIRAQLGEHHADRDVLVVLLPILIVLSSLLFLLVIFLVLTIILRKRRGIALGDGDGPADLSRDEFADGAGGFAGVESRWLEEADEEDQRLYQRAKSMLDLSNCSVLYACLGERYTN